MRLKYFLMPLLLAVTSYALSHPSFFSSGRAPSAPSLSAIQVTGSPSSAPSGIAGNYWSDSLSNACLDAGFTDSSQPAASTPCFSFVAPGMAASNTPPRGSNIQHLKQRGWLMGLASSIWVAVRQPSTYVSLIIGIGIGIWVLYRIKVNRLDSSPAKPKPKNPFLQNPIDKQKSTDSIEKDKLIDSLYSQNAKLILREEENNQNRLIALSHNEDLNIIPRGIFIDINSDLQGRIGEKDEQIHAMDEKIKTQAAEIVNLRHQIEILHDPNSWDKPSRATKRRLGDLLAQEQAARKSDLAAKGTYHQTQLNQKDRDHQAELNKLQGKVDAEHKELVITRAENRQLKEINARQEQGANALYRQVTQIIVAMIFIDMKFKYRFTPTLKELLPNLPLDRFVPQLIDASTQFSEFKFVLQNFLPDYTFGCPCGGAKEQLASLYTGPNHFLPSVPTYGSIWGNNTTYTSFGAPAYVTPTPATTFSNHATPSVFSQPSHPVYTPPPITGLEQLSQNETTTPFPTVFSKTPPTLGNHTVTRDTGAAPHVAPTTAHTIASVFSQPRPAPAPSAASSVLAGSAPAPGGGIFGHLADAPPLSSGETDTQTTPGSIFQKQQAVNPTGTPSVPAFGSKIDWSGMNGKSAATTTDTSSSKCKAVDDLNTPFKHGLTLTPEEIASMLANPPAAAPTAATANKPVPAFGQPAFGSSFGGPRK